MRGQCSLQYLRFSKADFENSQPVWRISQRFHHRAMVSPVLDCANADDAEEEAGRSLPFELRNERWSHCCLHNSESAMASSESSKVDVAHPRVVAQKLAIVLRHGQQQIGERRRGGAFELLEALVLGHVHHDDGRLAVPGHSAGCGVRPPRFR